MNSGRSGEKSVRYQKLEPTLVMISSSNWHHHVRAHHDPVHLVPPVAPQVVDAVPEGGRLEQTYDLLISVLDRLAVHALRLVGDGVHRLIIA